MEIVCGVCKQNARPYNSEKGTVGETYQYISWELVNKDEYKARNRDGRALKIMVCPACYKQYTGNNSETVGAILQRLNKARKSEKEDWDGHFRKSI